MNQSDYEDRLNIPVNGPVEMPLYSNSGTLLAQGYLRVVIGGRGPYLEFERGQLAMEAFAVPEDQLWRISPQFRGRVYYIEHRSSDEANVKLYEQVREVDYADYKPELFYISPFELKDGEWRPLIEPLERGQKAKPETKQKDHSPQLGLFD